MGKSIGAVLAAPLAVIMLIASMLFLAPSYQQQCTPTAGATAGAVPGYDTTQRYYAAMIVRIGDELKAGEKGQLVALVTARQESGIRNLNYGDRDSLNLFQQRPSQQWGTREQLMNPDYAIRAFYGGPTGPNYARRDPPGLLDIPGWKNMSITQAAQAVQRSALPDAYAKWENDARLLLKASKGAASGATGRCTAAKSATNGTPGAQGLVDDYYYKAQRYSSGYSGLRYGYGQCVDFVAWRLNKQAGVTKPPWKYNWGNLTPGGGHAYQWVNYGHKADTTPTLGAVAWWGRGQYGHVAIVSKVFGDGRITIEEYNYVPRSYSVRTLKAGGPGYPEKFLHIHDIK